MSKPHQAFETASTTSDHPRDNGIACALFAAGSCPLSKCPYMHVNAESRKALRPEVCNFYSKYRCLRDNCPYFHQTQTELDKLVATGATEYCPLDGMPRRNPLLPIPEDEAGLAAGEITGVRAKGSTEPRPVEAVPPTRVTTTQATRDCRLKIPPSSGGASAQGHRGVAQPYPFHQQALPTAVLPVYSQPPYFATPPVAPVTYLPPPNVHQVCGEMCSYVSMQMADGRFVLAAVLPVPSILPQQVNTMGVFGSPFPPQFQHHPMIFSPCPTPLPQAAMATGDVAPPLMLG